MKQFEVELDEFHTFKFPPGIVICKEHEDRRSRELNPKKIVPVTRDRKGFWRSFYGNYNVTKEHSRKMEEAYGLHLAEIIVG